MTSDQKIDKMLKENNICIHCGGVTQTASDYNVDTDEDQEYTYCMECGYEEGR